MKIVSVLILFLGTLSVQMYACTCTPYQAYFCRAVDNQILKAYPNPTADFLYLDLEEGLIEAIHIFDSTGKLVYNSKNPNPIYRRRIEVDRWPKGLYYIQVQTGNKRFSSKFLKH